MKKYKGGIKLILLIIITIVLIIGSTIMFGYGGQQVQNVKENVQDKAQEVIEDKGAEVVNDVLEGGQEVVGKTLKKTGEKILGEVENPGFYGWYGDDGADNYDKTILFFTADWCPSCTEVEADIEENKKRIPEDVAIVKIDFDNDEGLRDIYKVNKQHTFVWIDENNEVVKQWQNNKTLNEIINNLE